MGELIMAIIKRFEDNSYLEYARGTFDDWCVYMSSPNGRRYAPKDYEYFTFFKNLASKYSSTEVYDSFVLLYENSSKSIESSVLKLIEEISFRYSEDRLDVCKNFTIIYMGMIAEENKEFTKLGKRVKRLGFYQTIILQMEPIVASSYSKGKKWQELDGLCKSYGF